MTEPPERKRMLWQDAIEIISPYVVKINTPRGSGTGFYFTDATQPDLCAIATAAHVVDYESAWRQPISISHFESGKTRFLAEKERGIIIEAKDDTAAIVCAKGDFPFPSKRLRLTPGDSYLKIGNELGWLGFPALSPENLCFFSGRASCYIEDRRSYLVDGVAINGVSGGPAFFCDGDGGISAVGVVSAYMPNRARGDTLPGLLVIQDVTLLQDLVKKFRSIAEAKKKETDTQAQTTQSTAPAAAAPAEPPKEAERPAEPRAAAPVESGKVSEMSHRRAVRTGNGVTPTRK